jgi:predicted RNase H-like HicB family nuclease
MKKTKTQLPSGLHALLWKEENWCVARCLEVEVASQGKTKNEALKNLIEALELYFDEPKLPKPHSLRDVEIHQLVPHA